MRILIACEFSGIVRQAFRDRGHDAWSCDLLPAEDKSPFHLQEDAVEVSRDCAWDLMIAHPPCTFLANSGAKHLYLGMKKENGQNPERWLNMQKAVDFFLALLDAPIEKIAVENPIMLGHAQQQIGPVSQIIQPWQFGHPETKATTLRLKNLPPLKPTNVVSGREGRVWKMGPSPDRWKERSRTLPGIAAAFAEQWG